MVGHLLYLPGLWVYDMKMEMVGQLVMVKRILRAARTKRTRIRGERQALQTSREYDRLWGQERAYTDMIEYLKPMVEDLMNNIAFEEDEIDDN